MIDVIPWVLALIWMVIAAMSMYQASANKKQADKWWKALQDSQAQTQDVLDRWNKTIADYNRLIDDVERMRVSK